MAVGSKVGVVSGQDVWIYNDERIEEFPTIRIKNVWKSLSMMNRISTELNEISVS